MFAGHFSKKLSAAAWRRSQLLLKWNVKLATALVFHPWCQRGRVAESTRRRAPSAAARDASALKQPRRRTSRAVSRRVKRKRYIEAALMRKMLDVAQEYLELQHLRIEVEKAEMELRKRLDHRDDRKKR
jgi:hypothetical protein